MEPNDLVRFRALLRGRVKDTVIRVALASRALGARDALRCWRGKARAVILTYHRVGGCDMLTCPAEVFRRDMQWLAECFECLTLAGMCARLDADEPLRRPLAAVTFDDGYRDNALEAAPILRAAGVPATFFVATGYVGTDREFPHDRGDPDRRWPKLTWDDLREMQDAGFEVGSHTVSHCDLGRADAATVRRELCDSRAALDRELEERPRAFAYPWGAPSHIPPAAAEHLVAAGYYAAVTTRRGEVSRATDRFALPRIDVGNGMISSPGFQARVMQLPGVGRG